tara:strand:- start:2092 stop:3126 length:1035 start_codon:yes stop_codon:yes gene_type:complete
MLKRKYLLALIPAFCLMLIPSMTIYAIAQPDNDAFITQVNAYTYTLEKGDLLIVAEYDIQYSTIPTDYQSNEAFFIQLLNSNEIIGTNTIYPFNQNGYNKGAASVYLTAAQTLAEGLTDSSGNWTSWGPSTFSSKIVGNPIVWSTVPSDTQNLTTADFSSDQTKATNESELQTRVMAIAQILEGAWSVTMVSSDPDVLSDTGAQYFPLAIPELFRMVEGIQLISTLPAAYPTPVGTPGTFATASQDRYSSTAWIQGGFDSLAADTGLSSVALRAIFMTIIGMIVIGIAGYSLGTSGALLGFAGLIVIGIPVFVSQGFLPWAFAILIAALVTLFGFLKLTGRLET